MTTALRSSAACKEPTLRALTPPDSFSIVKSWNTGDMREVAEGVIARMAGSCRR